MGIGKTIVERIVFVCCEVVINFYGVQAPVVTWPRGDYAKKVITGFFKKGGLPDVIGSIDGTHIPIHKLGNEYYNKKKRSSIAMQCVFDHQCRVTDYQLGFPGSIHDSRIFSLSNLSANVESSLVCQDEADLVQLHHPDMPGGIKVFPYMIGDTGYALQESLIVPYKMSNQVNVERRGFNYYISKTHITSEHVFGRMKGRWTILLDQLPTRSLERILQIIESCVLLHNVCEIRKVSYSPIWDTSEKWQRYKEQYQQDEEDDEIDDWNLQIRGLGDMIRLSIVQHIRTIQFFVKYKQVVVRVQL